MWNGMDLYKGGARARNFPSPRTPTPPTSARPPLRVQSSYRLHSSDKQVKRNVVVDDTLQPPNRERKWTHPHSEVNRKQQMPNASMQGPRLDVEGHAGESENEKPSALLGNRHRTKFWDSERRNLIQMANEQLQAKEEQPENYKYYEAVKARPRYNSTNENAISMSPSREREISPLNLMKTREHINIQTADYNLPHEVADRAAIDRAIDKCTSVKKRSMKTTSTSTEYSKNKNHTRILRRDACTSSTDIKKFARDRDYIPLDVVSVPQTRARYRTRRKNIGRQELLRPSQESSVPEIESRSSTMQGAQKQRRTYNRSRKDQPCRKHVRGPNIPNNAQEQLLKDLEPPIRKQILQSLIFDAYNPGVIQDTVDSKVNFNEIALSIVYNSTVQKAGLPPIVEPPSMIEAFHSRVEFERKQMRSHLPRYKTGLGKETKAEVHKRIIKDIKDYFSQHYMSPLNSAIEDLLTAEYIAEYDNGAPANMIAMDIVRTNARFPDSDKVRLLTYSGVTHS